MASLDDDDEEQESEKRRHGEASVRSANDDGIHLINPS
jgi:hypothetical protein